MLDICANIGDTHLPTIFIHDFQASISIIYDAENKLQLHVPSQPYLIDSPEWITQTESDLQNADTWNIGAVFYGILLSNTYK
jgi:hypothetical protein